MKMRERILQRTTVEAGGVQFDKASECFVGLEEGGRAGLRRVRLKGLVPALSAACWPRFSFRSAVRLKRGSSERAPIVQGGGRGAGTARAGLRRGKSVDEALTRAVRDDAVSPGDAARMPACRATRHVLMALHKLGLRPILTQVPVHGMPHCRVATAVDVVCLNRNNEVVLVEVKTGFANYYDVGRHDMHGCFAGLKDSPRNQHQVQLALTCEMFENTTRIPVREAYVVRAIAEGVQYIPLAPPIRDRARPMLRLLGAKYRV